MICSSQRSNDRFLKPAHVQHAQQHFWPSALSQARSSTCQGTCRPATISQNQAAQGSGQTQEPQLLHGPSLCGRVMSMARHACSVSRVAMLGAGRHSCP